LGQPSGAAPDVAGMARLAAHAREPEELFQLGDRAARAGKCVLKHVGAGHRAGLTGAARAARSKTGRIDERPPSGLIGLSSIARNPSMVKPLLRTRTRIHSLVRSVQCRQPATESTPVAGVAVSRFPGPTASPDAARRSARPGPWPGHWSATPQHTP